MPQSQGSTEARNDNRALLHTTLTSVVAIAAVVAISGYALHSVRHLGETLGVETAQVGETLAQAYETLAPVIVHQMPIPQNNAPALTGVAVSPPAPTAPPPQFVPSRPQPAPTVPPTDIGMPVPHDLSGLLDEPDVVRELLGTIAQAPGITAPGEVETDHPIYAFFDPRCPHCHRAFIALNGKLSVRWLPTLALGQPETGEPLIAGLVGQTEAALEAGMIVAVTLPDDPARLDRLTRAMEGERIAPGEVTESIRFLLDENLNLAMQLNPLGGGGPFGVPTFIVPKPDGTALFIRGWDPERTFDALHDAYAGGT